MADVHQKVDEKNRRYLRNYLVLPEFQLPLIIVNVVLIGMSLLVLWVTGQETIGHLQPTAALSGVEVQLYRRILDYHSSQLHFRFLLAAVTAIVISSVTAIYLTHRMAGPMVALRKYFLAMKAGVDPLPDLYFRNHDFLQDIPPLVNDAIAALTARLESQKRESA